jgi:hypothetical protein
VAVFERCKVISTGRRLRQTSTIKKLSVTHMSSKIPLRDEVGPATALRLNVAAALAFPDGSMTVSGHGYDAEAWLVAAEASTPKLAGGSAP